MPGNFQIPHGRPDPFLHRPIYIESYERRRSKILHSPLFGFVRNYQRRSRRISGGGHETPSNSKKHFRDMYGFVFGYGWEVETPTPVGLIEPPQPHPLRRTAPAGDQTCFPKTVKVDDNIKTAASDIASNSEDTT